MLGKHPSFRRLLCLADEATQCSGGTPPPTRPARVSPRPARAGLDRKRFDLQEGWCFRVFVFPPGVGRSVDMFLCSVVSCVNTYNRPYSPVDFAAVRKNRAETKKREREIFGKFSVHPQSFSYKPAHGEPPLPPPQRRQCVAPSRAPGVFVRVAVGVKSGLRGFPYCPLPLSMVRSSQSISKKIEIFFGASELIEFAQDLPKFRALWLLAHKYCIFCGHQTMFRSPSFVFLKFKRLMFQCIFLFSVQNFPLFPSTTRFF